MAADQFAVRRRAAAAASRATLESVRLELYPPVVIMKLLLFPVVALCAVLAGCAGLASKSPEEMRAADPGQLCFAYKQTHSPVVRQVLEDRGIVKPEQWVVIDKGTTKIGFSEAALVCALGYPVKVNDSVSRAGVSRQWVFRNGYRDSDRLYIYTDGSEVTGWN